MPATDAAQQRMSHLKLDQHNKGQIASREQNNRRHLSEMNFSQRNNFQESKETTTTTTSNHRSITALELLSQKQQQYRNKTQHHKKTQHPKKIQQQDIASTNQEQKMIVFMKIQDHIEENEKQHQYQASICLQTIDLQYLNVSYDVYMQNLFFTYLLLSLLISYCMALMAMIGLIMSII